jgi:hypothetical protein
LSLLFSAADPISGLVCCAVHGPVYSHQNDLD